MQHRYSDPSPPSPLGNLEFSSSFFVVVVNIEQSRNSMKRLSRAFQTREKGGWRWAQAGLTFTVVSLRHFSFSQGCLHAGLTFTVVNLLSLRAVCTLAWPSLWSVSFLSGLSAHWPDLHCGQSPFSQGWWWAQAGLTFTVVSLLSLRAVCTLAWPSLWSVSFLSGLSALWPDLHCGQSPFSQGWWWAQAGLTFTVVSLLSRRADGEQGWPDLHCGQSPFSQGWWWAQAGLTFTVVSLLSLRAVCTLAWPSLWSVSATFLSLRAVCTLVSPFQQTAGDRLMPSAYAVEIKKLTFCENTKKPSGLDRYISHYQLNKQQIAWWMKNRVSPRRYCEWRCVFMVYRNEITVPVGWTLNTNN